MGQLYTYRGIRPTVAASAAVFTTAEITGDVLVGEHTIIGAGGHLPELPPMPSWALRHDDLPEPAPGGPIR